MSKYINCESNVKPQEKGFYNIYIEGVRSSLPQYLEFDSENWLNLEITKQENESQNIYWIEGDKPLKKLPVFDWK